MGELILLPAAIVSLAFIWASKPSKRIEHEARTTFGETKFRPDHWERLWVVPIDMKLDKSTQSNKGDDKSPSGLQDIKEE